MKRIASILVLLAALAGLLPSHASAAITLVRYNCNDVLVWVAGSLTWTYATAAPATNNLSVFVFVGETRYLDTAAGSGMTYARVGSPQNNTSAGFQTTMLWALGNGSDTTATLNLNGAYAGVDSTVCYLEFTGNSTDQSGITSNGSVANTSTTTHNSGTVTPPTADNVIIDVNFITGNDSTPDGAFTMLTTGDTQMTAGYFIQAAATAQEFNMDTTPNNRFSAMVIGAFAGTSSAVTPKGLMLGVYP